MDRICSCNFYPGSHIVIIDLWRSRLGLGKAAHGSGGSSFRKSSQSRLLCFVVTAIAKLASYHRELLPRARVSLAKVGIMDSVT